MKTTTLRCADRTFDVRVVPRNHHHHNARAIVTEMAAEAKQHGYADDLDGYLVVLPPETETDSAFRLHSFNPACDPAQPDGVDALCAFRAYQNAEVEAGDPTGDSLALRLGDLIVTLSPLGDETIEADLGKPSLEPADAAIDITGLVPVQSPHTYEIELDGFDEAVIVTLVVLEGVHAVIFTQSLGGVPLDRIGPALDAHRAFPKGCTTHAAVVEAPGEVTLQSWQRGVGVTPASGLGLGAICAAGVTNACTIESNAARLPDGHLAASWDGDRHVRLRGRVEATAHSAA